jgi:hypothetical protein
MTKKEGNEMGKEESLDNGYSLHPFSTTAYRSRLHRIELLPETPF